MSIVTHWLFSYPVICPLLSVHGYCLQRVSYSNYLTMSIVTHWLFSYPIICPLLYVHGYWIGFLKEVSYFELPHCYALIVPCNMSTALCTWILLSACKLFELFHYEHCYTLIVFKPCNMSTALCTWILNLVPSGGKLFQTTSLWALLYTDYSHTL